MTIFHIRLQNYMLSYFYRRTEKTSRQQLEDDFGEFPPHPLESKDIPFRFNLVRVRGPGALYGRYVQWKTVLKAFNDNPLTVDAELRSLLCSLPQRNIRPANANTRVSSDGSGTRLLIPIPIIAAKLAFSFWRRERRGMQYLGQYIPAIGDNGQITVVARADRHHGGSAPIISHEHLHFLQHQNNTYGGKAVPGITSFLEDEKITDPIFRYLLEHHEVEARLHEVVLSAYRGGHHLPLTTQGFLAMLCSCKELNEILMIACETVGINITYHGPAYSSRDRSSALDLDKLMTFSKNNEICYRFATEVLVVMYGNLLRYYGDEQASTTFLAQAKRPNLYDQLYCKVQHERFAPEGNARGAARPS